MDSEPATVVRRFPLPELSVGVWVVLLSFLTILGADLLWAVAIGDAARHAWAVPDGIPFASAPQVDWHNPIVLAQLLLSTVHATGPWGLAALHLFIVGLTLTVLVVESRRLGGGDLRTAFVVALVVVGCSSPFVVTRLPDLSLVPFVAAVAVMRRRHEQPGRGVWWLVPLFALWGNLHGGVLVGMAVLWVFLMFSSGAGRPLERVALGAACLLSLLVTSAGISTPVYYIGVLTNEAAARRSDLWAAPDLSHPLDLAMVLAVTLLLLLCLRQGLPPWEWAVTAGLALGTFMAARNGVWLVLFLAPAAAAQRRSGRATPATSAERPPWWVPVVVVTGVAAVVVTGLSLSRRGDELGPAGAAVVQEVQSVAAGRPVLADEPVAETLAQAGVTVWAANPIDAFPRSVQASFLDFLEKGRVPLSADVDVIVVAEDKRDDVLAQGGWAEAAHVSGYAILTRSP